MTKSEKISEYYNLYTQRIGKKKLTSDEYQPLVLNIAYLEIVIAKKNNIPYDTRSLFIEYTQAALEVIPEYHNDVKDPRYSALYFGFDATAEWDGLWNFLIEYFESKLGISLDNDTRTTYRLDSTFHKRYEYGTLITTSEANRKVTIILSDDKRNGHFFVSDTLSNKEANLTSVNGNRYLYTGTDPDFLFEFVMDNFNNVEKFSITRTDKNLRIDYFE